MATLLLLAVFIPYYLTTLDFSKPMVRDGTRLVVGRDFLNFWIYGRAAWEADPERYYDLRTYWRTIEELAGAGYPGQQWSYPPSVMLLAAPFGRLPYFVALGLWTAIGAAAFIASIRLWTADRRMILPLVLAPAAVFGLISGQFAYLAAAALLAVLRWRGSSPILAGVILGLLTIKPQLGLLFPVMLIATRDWRVIGVAGLTGIAIAALTALIWGLPVWEAYFRTGINNQSLVLSDPDLLVGPFMPTVFVNARLPGLPMDLAWIVQATASLGAAALVFAVFRRRPAATDLRANGIFLAAMLFGTPYLMAYDTLALTTAAVLLIVTEGRGRVLPLLIFFLPLLQMVAGQIGVPGPAIIPILFAVWLAREQKPSG